MRQPAEMRYINVEMLELPHGWQDRANTALSELRQEISQAEARARAAEQDVVAARKKAIGLGLQVPTRMGLWRELRDALGALTGGKCWYSESRNPTADKNVDHFRPKNRVHEDANHEGYWWLAFQWRNYRYASQWCNQRRVDSGGGTRGGKADCFPLCQGSFRARSEVDDYEREEPELLDPIDPEDWRLLTFRQDGYPTAAREPGSVEYQRATTSIEVYHLHCNELVKERRVLAAEVQRIVQDIDRLRPEIVNAQIKTVYKNRQKDLLRMIRPLAEYCSAALAFARSEVWTMVEGRHVKREWLEEMLSN